KRPTGIRNSNSCRLYVWSCEYFPSCPEQQHKDHDLDVLCKHVADYLGIVAVEALVGACQSYGDYFNWRIFLQALCQAAVQVVCVKHAKRPLEILLVHVHRYQPIRVIRITIFGKAKYAPKNEQTDHAADVKEFLTVPQHERLVYQLAILLQASVTQGHVKDDEGDRDRTYCTEPHVLHRKANQNPYAYQHSKP